MYQQHGKFVIHRDCLPSAPLPYSHRSLTLDALEALHRDDVPTSSYHILEYDVANGEVSVYRISRDGGSWQTRDKWTYTKASNRVISDPSIESSAVSTLLDRSLPEWHTDVVAFGRDATVPTAHLCLQRCAGCQLQVDGVHGGLKHKTTMRRRKLSRPIRNALRDGLLPQEATLFDYGCGHGNDVDILSANGYRADGWDPVYRPEKTPRRADIVNLGYVLNVIPDLDERICTLSRAYDLARSALIVAAQIHNGVATKHSRAVPFGDGVITSTGSFQRLYKLRELRRFIELTLQRKAHARDLGIFYVFASDVEERRFITSLHAPKARSIDPRYSSFDHT